VIKEFLYTTLKNTPAISAIVAARIYPNILPQDCTLPAISFSRVSASRGLLHSGDSHVVDALYQINVWSADAKLAETLSLAIKSAFHGLKAKGTSDEIMLAKLMNEVDLTPDADMNEYHIALDFNIQHRES